MSPGWNSSLPSQPEGHFPSHPCTMIATPHSPPLARGEAPDALHPPTGGVHPPALPRGRSPASRPSMHPSTMIRMVMPAGAVGAIIGKGGAGTKQISKVNDPQEVCRLLPLIEG